MAAPQTTRARKQEELGLSVSWEGWDTWLEIPRDTHMKAGSLEKEVQQGWEMRAQDP